MENLNIEGMSAWLSEAFIPHYIYFEALSIKIKTVENI